MNPKTALAVEAQQLTDAEGGPARTFAARSMPGAWEVPGLLLQARGFGLSSRPLSMH